MTSLQFRDVRLFHLAWQTGYEIRCCERDLSDQFFFPFFFFCVIFFNIRFYGLRVSKKLKYLIPNLNFNSHIYYPVVPVRLEKAWLPVRTGQRAPRLLHRHVPRSRAGEWNLWLWRNGCGRHEGEKLAAVARPRVAGLQPAHVGVLRALHLRPGEPLGLCLSPHPVKKRPH